MVQVTREHEHAPLINIPSAWDFGCHAHIVCFILLPFSVRNTASLKKLSHSHVFGIHYFFRKIKILLLC